MDLEDKSNLPVAVPHEIWSVQYEGKQMQVIILPDSGVPVDRYQDVKENLLNLAHQLVKGVQFLHKLNIVHMDIRPNNLLVNDEGKLTIIDFNCTEFTDVNLSSKGLLCEVEPDFGRIGTWTAPDAEQNPISGDVYSCGAVITRLMIISCRDDENAKLLKALGMRMQASRFSNRPSLDEVEEEISCLIASEN